MQPSLGADLSLSRVPPRCSTPSLCAVSGGATGSHLGSRWEAGNRSGFGLCSLRPDTWPPNHIPLVGRAGRPLSNTARLHLPDCFICLSTEAGTTQPHSHFTGTPLRLVLGELVPLIFGDLGGNRKKKKKSTTHHSNYCHREILAVP